MTGVRRIIVLVLATCALAVGTTLGSAPAHAAYTDKAATALGVSTVTVAAPGQVSTGGTKCETTYDAATMRYTTTLHAKVSWRASATRGVTGYVISALFADGSTYPVTYVAAPGTSASGSYDAYYATQNIRVVVTTYTSYGWTASAAPSGVIKC